MSKPILEDVVTAAVGFHGHLGPFLILGLKAGLFACEVLGKNCFEIRAIVETESKPPYSCFIDGVQVSTGCTMGKGNIEFKQSSHLSAIFKKDGKELRLTLRKNTIEKLRNISQKDESEKIALSLLKEPIQKLFIISETKSPPQH